MRADAKREGSERLFVVIVTISLVKHSGGRNDNLNLPASQADLARTLIFRSQASCFRQSIDAEESVRAIYGQTEMSLPPRLFCAWIVGARLALRTPTLHCSG